MHAALAQVLAVVAAGHHHSFRLDSAGRTWPAAQQQHYSLVSTAAFLHMHRQASLTASLHHHLHMQPVNAGVPLLLDINQQ
jgi:hypothetical protein